MIIRVLYLLLSIGVLPAVGQQSISFVPKLNQVTLELGQKYFLESQQDSIQVEVLQFYIADVQFFLDTLVVDSLMQKHFLIDLAVPNSLSIPLDKNLKYNKIKFKLGIDSLTNVSGAMDGDLDPTKGMYWTWQSGYINFKLEGTSPSCPARKHKFQYHIGGYQAPYSPLQVIELAVKPTEKLIININLEQFLTQIDLANSYQIMSPSASSVALSKLFPQLFEQAQ